MTRLFTIVFGAGLLRPAPGTWGSLVALPLAYGLHLLGGFWLLLGMTVLVSLLGWAAVAVASFVGATKAVSNTGAAPSVGA